MIFDMTVPVLLDQLRAAGFRTLLRATSAMDRLVFDGRGRGRVTLTTFDPVTVEYLLNQGGLHLAGDLEAREVEVVDDDGRTVALARRT